MARQLVAGPCDKRTVEHWINVGGARYLVVGPDLWVREFGQEVHHASTFLAVGVSGNSNKSRMNYTEKATFDNIKSVMTIGQVNRDTAQS